MAKFSKSVLELEDIIEDIRISNLLADHERIIKTLRTNADECEDKCHDMGTNDFLISIMQKHEKIAWMVRSHLQ